ncbi:ionotropic receptor 21a-like [Panulirus ornatus]|uniref:ionotropic receptor 21a-like n=1 Tax=Panulirus ornatus TaxID=150431 RepID=UPI003A8B9547
MHHMKQEHPYKGDVGVPWLGSSTEGEWMLYMNQLYWGQGVRHINTWRRHRFTHQIDLFPDKLSDLQGAVLRVTTFMFEPFVLYHWSPDGSLLSRYGVDIAVAKAVAHALNFTIKFMEPPNGEAWGEKSVNGSWSGMVGQLTRDEVDIGVADVFVSILRADALDFSAPYTSETMRFLARMEPPLPRWQALAFPFHKWTWLAIFVGLIISGPLLYLFACCSGRCGDEMSSLQTLSYSCYYAFGVHFCEAHASLPRMASTQILVMFLWLYTMILTIAYSTNLRAFLIVRKPPAMMETIRDLHDSGLQVAGIGDFAKVGMASSSDPYLQGLTKVYKSYNTRNEIYPVVLEGKAVFLGSRHMLEFLVNNKYIIRGVPRLRLMQEYFAPYSIAMALQRHSPLKKKVDQVIGRIQQSGLVRHFFLDSVRQAAAYEVKDSDGEGDIDGDKEEVAVAEGVIALGLDHMQGLFLLTGTGWVVCGTF